MPDTGKKKKKKPHRFYDYSLLFTIIFLTVFGLVMIYSASSYKAQLDYDNPAYFAIRQAAIAGGSFVVMYIVSKIDYHWFARFAVLGYALSWITMLLTMFSPLGVASHGKKRWLKVGPGMLQFQPTELVKISLILFVAVFIAELGTRINKLRPTLVIIGFSLPLALLVTANNLSSGIIICGIVFVMLFVACKIKWPFFACAGAGVGLLAAAPYIGHILVNMHILKDYQLGRINVWKNPIMYSRSGGYQVLQGLYAIGSGGLFGKGLGESLQKLGFVPEAQNDMIFSIICEGNLPDPDLYVYDLPVHGDCGQCPRSSRRHDCNGSNGAYRHSGYFEYCRSYQLDPQHGCYTAVYQLWRHIGTVSDAGDGAGA